MQASARPTAARLPRAVRFCWGAFVSAAACRSRRVVQLACLTALPPLACKRWALACCFRSAALPCKRIRWALAQGAVEASQNHPIPLAPVCSAVAVRRIRLCCLVWLVGSSDRRASSSSSAASACCDRVNMAGQQQRVLLPRPSIDSGRQIGNSAAAACMTWSTARTSSWRRKQAKRHGRSACGRGQSRLQCERCRAAFSSPCRRRAWAVFWNRLATSEWKEVMHWCKKHRVRTEAKAVRATDKSERALLVRNVLAGGCGSWLARMGFGSERTACDERSPRACQPDSRRIALWMPHKSASNDSGV
jgi:hypothetical protein